jgi:hypothetical protein
VAGLENAQVNRKLGDFPHRILTLKVKIDPK